ncbi:MAG: polysaccharide biosynthesis protein [Candidatus Thorarchaeota archaeon]
MFKDKTITIFGGSGSIGMLIAKALKPYKPHSIRIFSNDENSLWKAQQALNDNIQYRYILGDIREYRIVKRALRAVDYAFNCAAIKHVPIAEYNPIEAVQTNINGLDNIIEGCIAQNVPYLLHISTDKVVQPLNIMGATKMIDEQIIRMRFQQNPQINMNCIRLGNVWGSRGSIVPIIEKCMKERKAIPLTDERMERYFVKPEELAYYIITVVKMMEGGKVYVPKLKSYKIIDIIHEIASKNYPIEIIGKRPGEKLKEKLLSEKELRNAIELEDMWVI